MVDRGWGKVGEEVGLFVDEAGDIGHQEEFLGV